MTPRVLAAGKNFIHQIWREVAKFGVVGAIGFVIDSAIFLALITGPMQESHVKARLIAGGVAIIFSWVGNRYWTFRNQRTRTRSRELVLFIIMSGIGMGIQAACVFISFYGFGFTSAQASFVSGNIIGLGLAMCFRFFAYKTWVFTGPADSSAGSVMDAAVASAEQTGAEDGPHMISDVDIINPEVDRTIKR